MPLRVMSVLCWIVVCVAGVSAQSPRGDEDEAKNRAAPFRLVNSGTYVIREAYACAPRSPEWGVDLLGGRALKPGEQASIRLPGGCGVYDLRFVAEDGVEYLEEGVSFCAEGSEAEGGAGAAGSVSSPSEDAEDVVILGRDEVTKSRVRLEPR